MCNIFLCSYQYCSLLISLPSMQSAFSSQKIILPDVVNHFSQYFGMTVAREMVDTRLLLAPQRCRLQTFKASAVSHCWCLSLSSSFMIRVLRGPTADHKALGLRNSGRNHGSKNHGLKCRAGLINKLHMSKFKKSSSNRSIGTY